MTRRSANRHMPAWMTLLVASLVFTTQGSAAAGMPASLVNAACSSKWRIIPSPNLGPGTNVLSAVSADSASDAWAVGYNVDSAGRNQTLILHWDGAFWSIRPSPGAPDGSLLNGVSVVSPTDVWAVGRMVGRSGVLRTLIEHWDGARWSTVPSPNEGRADAFLVSTSFDSPSDGWAVGTRALADQPRPLALHWDGSSWLVASHPDNASRDSLKAVSAASPTDAWAVGTKRGTPGGPSVAWHWDGVRWSFANNAGPKVQLTSVSALSDGEAWAGGRLRIGTVEHWTNPSAVTIDGAKITSIVGISAISSSDMWAVDTSDSSYFDGTRWREVPIAHPVGSEFLTAVSYVPGKAFAVGGYVDGHVKTLVETHC
jgi:hypothetical protein